MDAQTYEQVAVGVDVFGAAAAWLGEGQEVTLCFHDGAPVSGELPAQVGGWAGGLLACMRARACVCDRVAWRIRSCERALVDGACVWRASNLFAQVALEVAEAAPHMRGETAAPRCVRRQAGGASGGRFGRWTCPTPCSLFAPQSPPPPLAHRSYKPAVLQNGVKVMVPPFIERGDRVVVDTAEGSFVRRA